MQAMAEGWLALELTDSAFLVGLVAAAASLPVLLFTVLAGVYVDRADRLRVVTAMQALMLCQAIALWLMTLTGHLTIGWLVALAFVGGTFAAFEIPARQSLFVDLVGRDDLAARSRSTRAASTSRASSGRRSARRSSRRSGSPGASR